MNSADSINGILMGVGQLISQIPGQQVTSTPFQPITTFHQGNESTEITNYGQKPQQHSLDRQFDQVNVDINGFNKQDVI